MSELKSSLEIDVFCFESSSYSTRENILWDAIIELHKIILEQDQIWGKIKALLLKLLAFSKCQEKVKGDIEKYKGNFNVGDE